MVIVRINEYILCLSFPFGQILDERITTSLKFDKFCAPQKKENLKTLDFDILRDHPFKTSAFLRGRGVKNLPTDSSKKLPTEGSRAQKS